MRTKKEIIIDHFDNFDKNSNAILTKTFYNYKPSTHLNNSKGVKNALFPKNPTSNVEKELNIAATGITSVNGLAYFKQFPWIIKHLIYINFFIIPIN